MVAIFSASAEISVATVLNSVPDELKEALVWFIVLFPSLLVIIFFITLNFNPKALYAPGDYTDERNFYNLHSESQKFDGTILEKKEEETLDEFNDRLKENDQLNSIKRTFSLETRRNVEKANEFFDYFIEFINKKDLAKYMISLGFGAAAPEYFLLEFSIPKIIAKNTRTPLKKSIIIKVTENKNGAFKMIALGKGIVQSKPKEFASKIADYYKDFVCRSVDDKKFKNYWAKIKSRS